MEPAREPPAELEGVPLVPLRPAGAEREPARAEDRRLEPWSVEPRAGVGATLDLAALFLRTRFGTLVGACALLFLPVRALQPFFGAHVLEELTLGGGEAAGGALALGALFLVWMLLGLLAQVLGQALVTAHLEEEASGAGASLRRAWGRALSRLPAVLVLSTVGAVVTGLATCFFLLPGLLVAWKLSLLVPALVAERATMGKALQRSFELTRGSFGRFLGVVGMGWLLSTFAGGLTSLVDDPSVRAWILEQGIPALVLDLVFVPVSTLGLALSICVLATVVYAYYLDCRARREGRDLEVHLERLTAAAPRSRPA